MLKSMSTVYGVRLIFTGNDKVWLRFGGAWCPNVNYEAEFVGFQSLVEWLDTYVGDGDFVPAFNVGGNEDALSSFKAAYLLNFDDGLADNFRNTVLEDLLFTGHLFHYTEEDGVSMTLQVYPTSICTYEDSDTPLQLTCVKDDVNVVFGGRDLNDLYGRLCAGMGDVFANTIMALYELEKIQLHTPMVLAQGWEITLRSASPGAEWIKSDSTIFFNPVLNEFRITVEVEGEDTTTRHIRFTTVNQQRPEDLLEELESTYLYTDIQHRNAMALFQLRQNPYVLETSSVLVVDDGDYSVSVEAYR